MNPTKIEESVMVVVDHPPTSFPQTQISGKVSTDIASHFLQYLEENDSSSSNMNDDDISSRDSPSYSFDPSSFLSEYSPEYQGFENLPTEQHSLPIHFNDLPCISTEQIPIVTTNPYTGATLSAASKGGLSLRILGVPNKSRVETQLKLCLQLVNTKGNTVSNWKNLLLPKALLVTGKRTIKKEDDKKDLIGESLKLEARVICASDQSKPVARCFGCIQRERRLSERKSSASKTKRVKEEIEESPFSIEEEQRKILQFYCNSSLDFTYGEAIIPTRITCYCRHHDEKVGFQIYISLKDARSEQEIASGISSPVLITDDHKSKSKKSTSATTPGTTTTHKRLRTADHEEEESPHEVVQPLIEKVIPTEGPMTGGIEVTVLGNEFTVNNTVLFGDNEAINTGFWGPKTLICILPPSLAPMTVPVTIKNVDNEVQTPIMFTYRDDSDRMMLELALQVIGMKLTGRIDDARQIAMRIVSSNQQVIQQGISSRQGNQPPYGSYYHKTLDESITQTLKDTLSLDTGHQVNLSLQNKRGQTLLHLAVIQGCHYLAKLLIRNGINVNAQDSNGFTALMYASLYGYSSMAQVILKESCGNINLSLQNGMNQSALDIANSLRNDHLVEILKKPSTQRMPSQPKLSTSAVIKNVSSIPAADAQSTQRHTSAANSTPEATVVDVSAKTAELDEEISVMEATNGKHKEKDLEQQQTLEHPLEYLFLWWKNLEKKFSPYRKYIVIIFCIVMAGLFLYAGYPAKLFKGRGTVHYTPPISNPKPIDNGDSGGEFGINEVDDNKGLRPGDDKNKGIMDTMDNKGKDSGDTPDVTLPDSTPPVVIHAEAEEITAFSWILYISFGIILICFLTYRQRHTLKMKKAIALIGIFLLVILFILLLMK